MERTMERKTHIDPLLVADRSGRSLNNYNENDVKNDDDDDDDDNNNNNNNNNCYYEGRKNRNHIDVDKMSKKLRRRTLSDESSTRNIGGNSSPSSPPRQWWFSRPQQQQEQQQQRQSLQSETSAPTFISTPTSSGMVLSEHLGSTSDVVESLTHDVKNWSLTRLPPSLPTAENGTFRCSDPCLRNTKKKEKQRRCKEAQRQVRMAQRRFLEEQEQLVSSNSLPLPP